MAWLGILCRSLKILKWITRSFSTVWIPGHFDFLIYIICVNKSLFRSVRTRPTFASSNEDPLVVIRRIILTISVFKIKKLQTNKSRLSRGNNEGFGFQSQDPESIEFNHRVQYFQSKSCRLNQRQRRGYRSYSSCNFSPMSHICYRSFNCRPYQYIVFDSHFHWCLAKSLAFAFIGWSLINVKTGNLAWLNLQPNDLKPIQPIAEKYKWNNSRYSGTAELSHHC